MDRKDPCSGALWYVVVVCVHVCMRLLLCRGLESMEHYVVTCPPRDIILKRTDRVYVLLTGVERLPVSADRVVKRINAHLARNHLSKGDSGPFSSHTLP